MADNNPNVSTIKLQYFENSYPDEGDFTLVYNLDECKQKFSNRLNTDFWNEFRDILDKTLDNKSLKDEWNDLRVNGYCKRCCTCCADDSCSCNGCCTLNCCRFCCCPGECLCCYGNCKACLSFRDYYIGGVVLVVFGVFQMIAYASFILIIIGAIMVENHRYSNELKDVWRGKVIQILAQDLNALAQTFQVRFTIDKYGIFGVSIGVEIIDQFNPPGQTQQQQTVMLVVQQPQPQPQQVVYIQNNSGPTPTYQKDAKVQEGGKAVTMQ